MIFLYDKLSSKRLELSCRDLIRSIVVTLEKSLDSIEVWYPHPVPISKTFVILSSSNINCVILATIDGDDIVYHAYCDVSVAVSSDRGLVVPVLRDAHKMAMHDIEKSIVDYAIRAQDGTLGIDEMSGGTFTISNGGVFGSLLSTPILNSPQSAILGMHKTQDRAVVVNGEIVIRPMMYLALSYDHRIIDGKEAVQFLISIKEALEDPARLLLKV